MSRGWLIKRDAYPNLLAHTPSGWAWIGFRIPGKTAYAFWMAISRSLTDAWQALCDMVDEVDYRTGTQFIGEWQDALSLPDPCLPPTASMSDKRNQIQFRLDKKRWTTAQDWKDLALLFGVRIAVVPGWVVQKPALYAFSYPKRYDLFPKLGRFRVYIDVVNTTFGGYNYGEADRGDGYPVPYGNVNAATGIIMCIINSVKPANVVIVWNTFPDVYECYGHETFDDSFSGDYC